MNNLIYKIAFSPFGIDSQVSFTQRNEILPLYILYTKDSFDEIGDPKVISQKGADLLTLWEDSFNSLKRNENDIDDKNEDKKEKNLIVKELKEKYIESRLDEELLIFE